MTARNADGATSFTTVPTAVVRAAPAPPSGCDGAARSRSRASRSEPAPDRRPVDQPGVVGKSTPAITVRFRVTCKGKPVQGAIVYGEAVPFNQFTAPAEQPTGADGWATLTMNKRGRLPRHRQQALLVVFGRARKAGEDILGGVSTRRLVSFPVDL